MNAASNKLLIFSITKRLLENILKGRATYVFRRPITPAHYREVLLLSDKVVASFEFKDIVYGSRQELWQSFEKEGGMLKDEFDLMFKLSPEICALEITRVFQFQNPIALFHLLGDDRPPHGFMYAKTSILQGVDLSPQLVQDHLPGGKRRVRKAQKEFVKAQERALRKAKQKKSRDPLS